MEKNAKIYVAGHNGMVGSAILRLLQNLGFKNLVYKTSKELDLRNQAKVFDFFEKEKPEYVFLAAAKVGGIYANNTYRADFLLDNLLIQTNVIHASWKNHVKKLLFLGSSCIYPKMAPQPIPEEALLTGPLEPTNEPYAIAKITGIKLCENFRLQYNCNFISAMPTNLYGPGDNYDLMNSHVLPALIRKFHEAKIQNAEKVVVWGDGSPLREFLHVDDLAEACVFLMHHYNDLAPINVGSQSEISIKDLALLIKEIIGFQGDIEWDTTKPNGTPRKLMDSSKIFSLGWKPKIDLKTGIIAVYKHFQVHYEKLVSNYRI
jgi:GDP-L-fucose synthase